MKYFPAILTLILLTKVILSSSVDWPIALTLLSSIASYAYIYVAEVKSGQDFNDKLLVLDEKLDEKINQLSSGLLSQSKDIARVEDQVAKLELDSVEINKLAEDSRKLISQANLGMAFRAPPRRNGSIIK